MQTAQFIIELLKAVFLGIVEGITAVSYTHLDVYKRQAYLRRTDVNRYRELISSLGLRR